jgi:thiol:disulfide interchange protein DsbA
MQLNRHFNIRNLLIGLLGALLLNNAIAASSPPIVEGTDYTVLNKAIVKKVEPKGKVNVKEFFSFVCIHCKDIEPLVASKLLANKAVDLDKIHVAWNPSTESYAKLNATLLIMKLDKLYTPAFTATFSQHDLNDPVQLKGFLSQNGLSQDQITKFMSTYNSFTVNSKVSEYKTQMEAYDISGTPTFVVGDKYVVSPALPERAMEVTQYLVKKSATEK